MKLFNSHTHTSFSHDANASIEDIILNAKKHNLSGFAITDHCDCEYCNDLTMINNVTDSFNAAKKFQQQHKNELIIACGVEMGEMLSNPSFAEKMIASYDWDVILGSVHAVNIPGFEMPFSVIDFSDKDCTFIDKYITKYFEELLLTAKYADYDILCHLTVILRYVVYKYKRTVDITKFYPIIEEILTSVIKREKTLEINTSGINDNYFMPDKDIILMYKKLGGKKITIGSDAHYPENIASGLNEAKEMLLQLDFDTLTFYIERTPIAYKLK